MLKFMNRHRGVRGSVTILMLIIMLPMLVFSFTLVDVCKIFMAKDVAADAAQLALNAGMTSYDKVLKDMYGILATSKTEDELAEKMSKYYAATLAANGLKDTKTDFKSLVTDLLGSIDNVDENAFKEDSSYLSVSPEKMSGSDKYVSVDAFDSSAASNPAVLERQILEYMKYRGPVSMTAGILEKLNVLKDLPNQAKVTTTRMEFEQELGDINNNAIDAYTLFQIYFYNNGRAETGSSELSIVYESEKTNLIKKYKYSGSALRAGGMLNASSELKKIECELKSASVAVMIYAPFYERMRSTSKMELISLSSSSAGSTSTLVSNLNSAHTALDSVRFPGGLTLDEATSALDRGKNYADKVCQFGASSWSTVSETDSSNSFKLMCAVWGFSKLFRGGKGGDTTNDPSSAVKEFLEAFKKAEAKADAESTSNEDKASLNAALNGCRQTYDDIVDALEDMEELVPYLSGKANQMFSQAVSKMNEMNTFANNQIKIIDELTKDNGLIFTLVEQFAKAKADAEVYQSTINNVESENQKNSAQQTYDHEAKDIEELSMDDANKLAAELKRQRAYYVKLREALLDMKVLSEYGNESAKKAVKEKSDGTLSWQSKFEHGDYCTSVLLNQATTNSQTWFYRFSLPGYSHRGESLGLGKWTENNNKTITENTIYQQLVKLSEPKEGKKKDDSLKKQVMENSSVSETKKDGETLPVDVKSVDEENSSSSEEDKKAFEAMASAEKFSDYIAKSAEATAVIHQTASLPDDKMKVSASCSTSGKDKDVSNDAINMVNAVSTLMEKLGEVLEDGRDALLVTEYLTGNFSCHTTSMDGKGNRKNDELMLSGLPFYSESDGKVIKNVGYGTELEYILYGCDTEFANKAAAGGTIFAIRFVLNLIYSFTDAEIRNFTFSIASAAAGWFPFAVPIVQTVLHIGLSLAESAIDLTELMNGAAVPLYKSATTWRCKGTNIVRGAVAAVVETVADAVIDEAADALCDAIAEVGGDLQKMTSEQKKKLDAYVAAQKENIQKQMKTTVFAPIREVIQECMLNSEELKSKGAAKAKEEIAEMLNTALDTLESSLRAQVGTGEEEDIVNQAMIEIVVTLKGKTGSISVTIFNKLDDFISVSAGTSAKTFNASDFGALADKLEAEFNDVLNTINKKYNEISSEVEKKINEGINELAEEMKKGVKRSADEIKQQLNASVSASVTGHKNTDIISAKGKTTSGMEHLLDMTYKDYMYVFTLIGFVANRDAMLERAALLMQANCKVRGAEANSGDTYTLNEARTFFSATAAASTSTVFYGAVFKDGKLDMSAARKKYEFTYCTYMGY